MLQNLLSAAVVIGVLRIFISGMKINTATCMISGFQNKLSEC